MNAIYFGFCLLGIFSTMLYAARQKKKLSDEQIIEFERLVKPAFLRMWYLSTIPLLGICIYLLTAKPPLQFTVFMAAILACIPLLLFGYFRIRKVIAGTIGNTSYSFLKTVLIFLMISIILTILVALLIMKDYVVFPKL